MARIIYIHGFLSSSQSAKAKETAAWVSANRPDIEFICPDLSSYPDSAIAQLKEHLKNGAFNHTYLIGSSLGGFWASFAIERGWAEKAVLVNPAVSPHTRFGDLVGQTLEHYYGGESVCLKPQDLEALACYESKHLAQPERYWLMAQKGDEVLDYKLAEARYQGSKQTIERGGNHSFEGYSGWLPDIIQFFNI